MRKNFSVFINNKIKKFNKNISTIPGCKSTSFRALIFSSQTIGISHLKGVLESDDIKCCIKSLKDLGVQIVKIKSGEYKIYGNGENSYIQPKKKYLYFGNAGTLGILMGFLSTSSNIKVKIIGDKSLQSRSMEKFITPLSKIGCTFYPEGKKNFPITIQGTDYGLAQHHIVNGSAQEKACILNAGLSLSGTTTIEDRKPCGRNHSEIMLSAIGARISIKKRKKYNLISLSGHQNLQSFSLNIPGDPSSGAFLCILCLMTKDSKIKLKKINLNNFRIGYIRCLKSIGANIKLTNVKRKFGEPVGDIAVKFSELRPINFPKKEVMSTIDELPVLMTLAATIDGVSTFNLGAKNIKILKGKESNRVKKMSENLKAFGIKTKITSDKIKVYGSRLEIYSKIKKINIKAVLDHRIQMSAILLGSVSKSSVTIKGCETIKTSFPNFFELLKKCGIKYEIKKN